MPARCGTLISLRIVVPWKGSKSLPASWLLPSGTFYSYEELLSLMDLKPLQNRRLESKLGLMFKLVNNLCFFPDNSWSFHTNSRCSRNSNSRQLSRPFARTNSYLNSFFPHTVAHWNLLDNKTVTASSYNSFMHSLTIQSI